MIYTDRRHAMISAIHARIEQFLFSWRLAYGGIILAVSAMQEMDAASSQHETAELTEQDVELAGTFLLRELRHRYGIDA